MGKVKYTRISFNKRQGETMKGNLVIGLFMALVVLVILAGLLSAMNTQITNIIATGLLNSFDETLLRLIPTAILITVFVAIFGGKIADGIF